MVHPDKKSAFIDPTVCGTIIPVMPEPLKTELPRVVSPKGSADVMAVIVVLETVCALLTMYWLAVLPCAVIIVPSEMPEPVNVLPMEILPEETEFTVSMLFVMEPVKTARVHDLKLVQSLKALSPMEVKTENSPLLLCVVGIFIIVSEPQLWKALAPMDEQLEGSAILVNALQPLKTSCGMDLHEEEIVILVSALQPWKALTPMDVHEGGIIILVSALQFWKALTPMDVHEEELVMILVSALQFWKALTPMDVHEGGIVILVSALQPWKVLTSMDLHEEEIVILVSALQFWKALAPMDVHEGGIVILVSALQFWKVLAPMDVHEGGIVILVSALQFWKALFPRILTEAPSPKILTVVRPEQPVNALAPIVVTLAGIVSVPVRPEQPVNALASIVVSAPSVLNVIEVILVFVWKAAAEIAVVPGRITMAPVASGLATTMVPE